MGFNSGFKGLSKVSPLFEYTVNKNNKSRHNFINNLSSATCFGFVIRHQAEYTIVVGTVHILQCRVNICWHCNYTVSSSSLVWRLPFLYSFISSIFKHSGDTSLNPLNPELNPICYLLA